MTIHVLNITILGGATPFLDTYTLLSLRVGWLDVQRIACPCLRRHRSQFYQKQIQCRAVFGKQSVVVQLRCTLPIYCTCLPPNAEVDCQGEGSPPPELPDPAGSTVAMRPFVRRPSQYRSASSCAQAMTQAEPYMCACCITLTASSTDRPLTTFSSTRTCQQFNNALQRHAADHLNIREAYEWTIDPPHTHGD